MKAELDEFFFHVDQVMTIAFYLPEAIRPDDRLLYGTANKYLDNIRIRD